MTWEHEAERWLAWARTPGHDVFPYFSSQFFDEVVPEARGLTLEVGCGEGRVARELVARGHRVVAVDAARSLVRHARDADPSSSYVVADGTRLPFADATFRAVVAYNALQTMAQFDDMARAVGEAARVLEPGGRFCLCVAHPMTDVWLVTGVSPAADVSNAVSYFDRRRVEDTVTQGGLTMTFHGWTYTLEDYLRALEDAGLLVERLREPSPSDDDIARRPALARWRRLPLFLSIRAVKR